MPNTDYQSSWRHSSEGHRPGWQGCEQDDRHRWQSRQQDNRYRRIRRQQDRRISDRYVRARRFEHEGPTRPDRAVASRLAHKPVESCGRGETFMKNRVFFTFCSQKCSSILMAVIR